MMELLGSGVLGSLFGGIFRIIPEILKWMDKKHERDHELKMFTLQTDLEKVRGEFKMAEKYVDHGIAQLDAIQEAFKEQAASAARAGPFVAAMSASVRPGITYFLFSMYAAFKIAMMIYAMQQGATWLGIIKNNWTGEDMAMLNMILTFWFVGRAIEKYKT